MWQLINYILYYCTNNIIVIIVCNLYAILSLKIVIIYIKL